MGPSAPSLILLELQKPSSQAAQIQALKALKNELIGHDQKKASWIESGIIPILSEILASRSVGKRSSREGHQNFLPSETRLHQSEDDEACQQAVIIVGSLAHGSLAQDGPSFVAPILAGNVVPSLLTILSAKDCPSALCLSILRTLNTIADRLPLQRPLEWPFDNRLSDLLFYPDHAETLARIFSQSSGGSAVQQSIGLAAALISKLCCTEEHKILLAECGVLDSLAMRLASFVVSQGFVLPGAESRLQECGLSSLPAPASKSARLAPILRAISIIIDQSKPRAQHFLTSPALLAVFPKQTIDVHVSQQRKAAWSTAYSSELVTPRHLAANPIDGLLPVVPPIKAISVNPSAFLSSNGQLLYTRSGQPYAPAEPPRDRGLDPPDEDESALVSWLIYLIREESSLDRLMAAKLVTILFRLGLAKRYRLSLFGFLVVPLLVRMLDKEYEVPGENEPVDFGIYSTKLCIKEEAPAILAGLVMDSQELQKLAVDAGAIKKLSQLLKESYNPINNHSRPSWNPEKGGNEHITAESDETKLGPPEVLPIVRHLMRFREGILKALAALAPCKDEYRKAICDNGVVPYIIDSLKPNAKVPEDSNANTVIVTGNPVPTLLAACGAARALTRSVSVLRTNLIDAGVAAPLFALLTNPDVEVQIAAITVICNLAMDFSPMKESIISAGVFQTLCRYAHSTNPRLQAESLWALKNFLTRTANDIKMKVVEDLDPVWMKQIIRGDLHVFHLDELGGSGFDSRSDATEDSRMSDSDYLSKSIQISASAYGTSLRRRKLTPPGENDKWAKFSDEKLLIQEQALSILQNLVCGPGASEMIDYLFEKFGGPNEVLGLLASKLQPQGTSGYIQSRLREHKGPIYAPKEILVSVTYVLTHIAAGQYRHKDLLVANPELITLLLPLFKHYDRVVRVNCAWFIINLTHEDDQSDHRGSLDRARKLKALGAVEILNGMQDDLDLDVRERAKCASHLLNSLLGS